MNEGNHYKQEDNKVPILTSRSEVDSWRRRLNDYCTGRKLWSILQGTEEAPVALTQAQVNAIPATSRYTAVSDREKKIERYESRCEEAFSVMCKSIEKDNIIYGCAQLDQLRTESPRNPRAALVLIMNMLQPSHVDAQMTVDALITSLSIEQGETVPALIQRLAGYVQRLPAANRPNDETMMKHVKRAVKKNTTQWSLFKDKIESLMDREPMVPYDVFCTSLMRKHEQIVAEEAQEAALNTESKQEANHKTNEQETAMFAKGSRGRRFKNSGKGRGGKGDQSARYQWQGSTYDYGKGGKGFHSRYNARSFHNNSGYRYNGGRGSGGSDQSYGYKGGAGKGMSTFETGGKSNPKRKFDGNCNRCGKYGHKEADCYSKKVKM